MLGKSKLTINLLYSAPLSVKDTKVMLDGDVILVFKNINIDEFPPHLGRKELKLKNGKHHIEVVDTNFGLKKKDTFDLKKAMWIDIIIHDDSISIHYLDKEPHYK